MEHDKIKLKPDDFELDFLVDDKNEESGNSIDEGVDNYYNVLIVDDDEDVHKTTKLVLRDFRFEGKRLRFIDAYSRKEGERVIDENDDIAVVLLDVVMEENNSGLEMIEYIRQDTRNMFTRIILRTGQPGQAPEEKVVVEYDINDYLLKTDITVQRIFTSMYQALRSYRDMNLIDKNRKGIEMLMRSSSEMFIRGSVQEFFRCILDELLGFRNQGPSTSYKTSKKDNGLVYYGNGDTETIITATGDFTKYVGMPIKEIEEFKELNEFLGSANLIYNTEVIGLEKGFLVWKQSPNNVVSFIFIESDINDYNLELIKVFLTNYSLALDNYVINNQIIETQVEIINTLGDVIESRSNETANHVKRVSEICYLFARQMWLPNEECTILKLASMVHDAGKIGISDNILLKPGKLTQEEFEIMKTHTEIGRNIFAKSKLEVLKRASEICYSHHEKINGTGYPLGLKGEEIPISARIVAVVDIFDAITHKRCYKDAWSIEQAVEYVKGLKGTDLDPKIVDMLIESIDEIKEIFDNYPD